MSYSKNQVRCLEAVFLSSPYPDSQAFEILAEELGLPEKKLKIWFQNKRARSKRRQSDQCRSPIPTVHHHPYLLPAASMLPAAFPSYQYIMPGVMMTQQGLMMTPSPEMQMMQHSVFSFPTSGSPTMASAHAQFSS
ncbi:homeobox protein engrailed-like ceh-16 [Haliotis cracherodii]|uniref:homeobox protein engrailed-like ceh-16 n=1 Tax=Haliotis cracherodii TaxID=6455 RepID=UPI0039E7F435